MTVISKNSLNIFDQVCRTNKAQYLLSFILASYNAQGENSKERRQDIVKRVASYFELALVDRGGTYSDPKKDIDKQFGSWYTMGLEMGIWKNDELQLSELAESVAKYEITVKDYIGTVFLNLFTYFEIDEELKYVHFLYLILEHLESNETHEFVRKDLDEIFGWSNAQSNLLIQYLIATPYFKKENNIYSLTPPWKDHIGSLKDQCNLEYQTHPAEAVRTKLDRKQDFAAYVTKTNVNNISSHSTKLSSGMNLLVFGAPGTGKSHGINSKYPSYKRVTFYPDFDYTQFVGGLKPVRSENSLLNYEFVPGVFTNVLLAAYERPNEEQGLIIEELNRANASAVFGDIFQLLDRDVTGQSTYAISNMELENYLDEKTNGKYDFKTNGIKIPGNMSLIATMNPADQGVFPLDSAFKRRWKQEYCPINWDAEGILTTPILGFDKEWSILGQDLNAFFCENLSVEEDALLGQYFLREIDNQTIDTVASKLLGYLWNDLARYDRHSVFNSDIITFSELLLRFKSEDRNQIFCDELRNVLNKKTKSV